MVMSSALTPDLPLYSIYNLQIVLCALCSVLYTLCSIPWAGIEGIGGLFIIYLNPHVRRVLGRLDGPRNCPDGLPN